MLTINKTFISMEISNSNNFKISNVCQFFLDSPYIEEYIKRMYWNVLDEFENYVLMLIERSRGKQTLFCASNKSIHKIHKTITNISPLIHKKIEESKTKEFGNFLLGEKYCLVKKIFELIDNSHQCEDQIYEDIKKQYFLGRDIFYLLLTHLYSESTKSKIYKREKPWKDYVWDFYYRNFKYFDIPTEDARNILDLFFGKMYKKSDMSSSSTINGTMLGLKKLYPGETIKVKIEGFAGQIIYGDWTEIGLVYGVVFYPNGDIYTGHWYGLKKEGNGWFKRANGEIEDGYFRDNRFISGTFKNGKEVEIVDLPIGQQGTKQFTLEDFKAPKLQKDIHERRETVLGLDTTGIYEGEFKDKRRNGTGKMYYSDGSLYVGKWKNDLREGGGLFYGIDESQYSGSWKLDKRDGFGKMFFPNGNIYEGEWKGGRMTGQGTMTMPNGETKVGKWLDNEIVANDLKIEEMKKKQFIQDKKKKSVLKKKSSKLKK